MQSLMFIFFSSEVAMILAVVLFILLLLKNKGCLLLFVLLVVCALVYDGCRGDEDEMRKKEYQEMEEQFQKMLEGDDTCDSINWNDQAYYYPSRFFDKEEKNIGLITDRNFNKYFSEGYDSGYVAGTKDFEAGNPYASYDFVGKYHAAARRAYMIGYWKAYKTANKEIEEDPSEEEVMRFIENQ